MAFNPPAVGERIICHRDNVGLYAAANPNSEFLKVNGPHKDDRELRGFRKDETMGFVLDNKPLPGTDGDGYLLIAYTLFDFRAVDLFGNGFYVPETHSGYIKVSDEPGGWGRATFEAAKQEVDQQQSVADTVTAYFTALSGVPKPTAVYEKNVDGKKSIWLDFANGYTVEFEAFKKLTPATQITNTTRDPLKSPKLNDGLTGDKKDGTGPPKKSFFTTTNILIGVAILALLGVIGILAFKPKTK